MGYNFINPFTQLASNKRKRPPREYAHTIENPTISILSDFKCKSPIEITKALYTWEGWIKTQRTLSNKKLFFNELDTRLSWEFIGYLAHWWTQTHIFSF